MKNILLVAALVIVFVSTISGAVLLFKPASDSSPAGINESAKLESYREIELGDKKVEVGSKSTKALVEPFAKFSSGNAFLSLAYPVPAGVAPRAGKDGIYWEEMDRELYFKNVSGETTAQDQFEFDILLKEKPQSNVFTYSLEIKNLDYFEKDGAYSFFKKGVKPGDSQPGVYGKGELFKIQKPIIVDANGKTVKGKFSATFKEEGIGNLSISVDPSFLASAAYPVVVGSAIALNDTNHMLVTKVDRFRWKLAVEYEIRNDEGELLGSDVAILEPNQGETAGQIFGFLQGYLNQRGAIWLLAHGQYKLYEMSMDRLSATHFQANDSADDVNDKYTLSRQARKQILESIKKEDYPAYSLTLEQASLLQEKDAFSVGNEKIGAGSEILRPNGAGDATGVSGQSPASGAHWDKVDESVADDATTYVYNSFSGAEEFDYYALQDTALTIETVSSIDVVGRGHNHNSGPGGFRQINHGVRRAGSNTMKGVWAASASWQTQTLTGASRPGGGSWVVSDLNGLQAAVSLYTDIDAISSADLSQIYVTVNYTAPAISLRGKIDIRGKVDF